MHGAAHLWIARRHRDCNEASCSRWQGHIPERNLLCIPFALWFGYCHYEAAILAHVHAHDTIWVRLWDGQHRHCCRCVPHYQLGGRALICRCYQLFASGRTDAHDRRLVSTENCLLVAVHILHTRALEA